jgi:hypothetical protein
MNVGVSEIDELERATPVEWFLPNSELEPPEIDIVAGVPGAR